MKVEVLGKDCYAVTLNKNIQGKVQVHLLYYNKRIASVHNGVVTLDTNYHNYSTTTAKFRNKFLAKTSKEVQAKIKSGEYLLADINNV